MWGKSLSSNQWVNFQSKDWQNGFLLANNEKRMIDGGLKTIVTMARAKEIKHNIEMCPPSKLGPFYEFISLSQI